MWSTRDLLATAITDEQLRELVRHYQQLRDGSSITNGVDISRLWKSNALLGLLLAEIERLRSTSLEEIAKYLFKGNEHEPTILGNPIDPTKR
jgi:hypothetical protein